jgi:proteasome assembly chaperone (PAC2) family protein
MARRYKACRIYVLGGVHDQVPHTRETSVYAVLSHPEMKAEFQSFPLLNYTGPCSFSTLLVDHARREGFEAASIVGRVPPYIATFNAKAGYEYLKKVLGLMSLDIDLSDLKRAGDAIAKLMDNDFRQNKTAREQLRKLEEAHDTTLFQDHGYKEVTVDELMQEMMNTKKDGRKPH